MNNVPTMEPRSRSARVAAASAHLEGLRARAVHESGHAVLGVLAGQPIVSATIAESPSLAYPGLTAGGRVTVTDGWTPQADPHLLHLAAISALAGVYAEERQSGRFNAAGAAGDLAWVDAYLTSVHRRVGLDAEEAICRTARTAVKAWYPTIAAVADELLEHTTLTGDQIAALIRSHAPHMPPAWRPGDVDRATCLHESAHALAAHLLGVPYLAVSVLPLPGEVDGQPVTFAGQLLVDESDRAPSAAMLVVALAGSAIDALTDRPNRQAISAVDLRHLSHVDPDQVAWAYTHALNLVKGRLKAMNALTEALLLRRILTADEVSAVVMFAGGATCPPDLPPLHHEVLKDTPLAYWRLNDPGTADSLGNVVAADTSGNNRFGLYQNVTLYRQPDPITDDADGAVTFNGVADHVVIPTPVPNATSAWTVELWWKRAATSAFEDLYFATDGSIYAGGVVSEGGFIRVDRAGSGGAILSTASSYDDNAWHHIAATFDGTDCRIYVDGVLDAGPTAAGANAFGVGASGYLARGNIGFFNGSLAEVAVYGSALSSTRVSDHYVARNAGLDDTTGARILRIGRYADLDPSFMAELTAEPRACPKCHALESEPVVVASMCVRCNLPVTNLDQFNYDAVAAHMVGKLFTPQELCNAWGSADWSKGYPR